MEKKFEARSKPTTVRQSGSASEQPAGPSGEGLNDLQNSNENRNSLTTTDDGSTFLSPTNDYMTSVIDRIRRKSFYTRFNEKNRADPALQTLTNSLICMEEIIGESIQILSVIRTEIFPAPIKRTVAELQDSVQLPKVYMLDLIIT
ncbi:hypothetical protein HUJ04_000456 [Dendroctonus ponderosae]|nr:hypothetical protein HUJ04_000456 [Dendroctonus ponderosae]